MHQLPPSLNIFGTTSVKKYENLSMTIGNKILLLITNAPAILVANVDTNSRCYRDHAVNQMSYVILLIILMLLSNDLNFVYTSNY